MDAEIGIIGGTGVAPTELLEDKREVKMHTPYGPPSDFITLGVMGGRKIAFLPRHGKGHTIQPGRINFRANIFALKELGVKRILAPSAVGSLQEGIRPGEFVFVNQFIDRTRGRASTFYDGSRVCHISVADPFCSELLPVLVKTAKDLNLPFHSKGTYVCIEGPRFSTRAESRLFRSWGCHVIGMTLVPECVLAREAEICYSSITMVTDYDTFREGQEVNVEEVLKTAQENEKNVKKLIAESISRVPEERSCSCKEALKDAII
jgi:5'-methylthioadenosine phosphorylase